MLEKATNGDEIVIKTILFPGMTALLVVELIVFGEMWLCCLLSATIRGFNTTNVI